MPPTRKRGFRRLGKHLRAVRERLGFSKMDLVRGSKFTLSHVQKMERGLLNVTFQTLRRLARFYGITISELMEGYE